MSTENRNDLTVNDFLMAVGVIGLLVAGIFGFITYANRDKPDS
jgi:hypothetical protein